MQIEYEVRILEIDKDKIISKLEELGAKRIFDDIQKRYVYDYNPSETNKWIRLRTNGRKSTLAIKEVTSNKIDGTKELEIEVSDFEKTKDILSELGYEYRSYQENHRIQYLLDDVEIDIDTWPMIPTYMEIEGLECKINDIIEKLGFKKEDAISLDVQSIYKDIYNIDIMNIKELRNLK